MRDDQNLIFCKSRQLQFFYVICVVAQLLLWFWFYFWDSVAEDSTTPLRLSVESIYGKWKHLPH
jgi:uncharacterized membrane protein